MESQLQDFARTRAIFELGVSQSPLSMPELLWKAYIDFEIEEGERETARSLYERLIELSGHVKVWISYALFEAEPIPVPRALREEEDEEDEEAEVRVVEGDATLARQVFERGYKDMKSKGLKSEVRTPFFTAADRSADHYFCVPVPDQRVALLEVWKTFEESHGSADDVAKVQGMMPIVSKRRHVDQETGQTVEGVYYSASALSHLNAAIIDWDMVFADDERESNPTSFKFLQMAHAWKSAQAKGSVPLSGFTAATAGAREEDDAHSDVASSHGDESD